MVLILWSCPGFHIPAELPGSRFWWAKAISIRSRFEGRESTPVQSEVLYLESRSSLWDACGFRLFDYGSRMRIRNALQTTYFPIAVAWPRRLVFNHEPFWGRKR